MSSKFYPDYIPIYEYMVSGVSPAAGPKKRPVYSKKKLCSLVSVVFGLWERFLTAITRSIVAGSHSHQPLMTA